MAESIGTIEAEMGAAAKKDPGIPPTEAVVNFPPVTPAVFVVTPDIGQGQEELGNAGNLGKHEAENKKKPL